MMTDTRQLTTEDVIRHMQVPSMSDLYVIGCFEKRVTIRSQQVRALNLVYSIHDKGLVSSGGKIAIMGGGAAGMTAAVGAARLGYRVTLLERQKTLLPIFQGNTTRWLHPYIFDWPELPGNERHDGGALDPDEAGLPLLSWRADFADAVAKELERKWENETAGLDIRIRRGVDSISLSSKGRRRVDWNLNEHSPDKGHDRGDYFEAVLLSVGFGVERKPEDERIPWVPYWKVDSLHQETSGAEHHLISGCGDGGLIDLLRVKLRRFNHKEFTEDFVRLTGLESLKEKLVLADKAARWQKDPGAYLRDQYEQLKGPEVKPVDDFLSKRLRDTRVTLTGLDDSPLTLTASILHRFLVSRLINNHFGVSYRPGGFKLLSSGTSGYEVQFKKGGKPVTFDRITCRHGPETPSAIEVDFPEYVEQFATLRNRNDLDQTRWPMWKKGVFDRAAASVAAGVAVAEATPSRAQIEIAPARDNPFRKAAALPLNAPSYIERPCDSQLSTALASSPLIAIHGGFELGKSSLLVRAGGLLAPARTTCSIDLQEARTEEPTIFHDRFFERVSRKLGPVRDWKDLEEAARKQPAAILIDELGHLTSHVAGQFIPSLYHLASTVDVRIVVCLPVSIQEFLGTRGIQNPKYARGWSGIEVTPLDEKGVDSLLNLLPANASAVAAAHRKEISAHARGMPQLLQILCYDLFDADRSGASQEVLTTIVRQWVAQQ
jgi:hypothetical protein